MSRGAHHHLDVTGCQRIDASAREVWRGLNDPDALAFSIRQCESMVREEADRFRGVFRVGVGPLKAPVGAFVTVVPDAPPYRYRLRCEMSVRFLGEADAEASLDLVEVDTGVDVNYRARVAVQGRLAGYGLEFLHAAVQRNIDQFFQRFGEWLSRGAP